MIITTADGNIISRAITYQAVVTSRQVYFIHLSKSGTINDDKFIDKPTRESDLRWLF